MGIRGGIEASNASRKAAANVGCAQGSKVALDVKDAQNGSTATPVDGQKDTYSCTGSPGKPETVTDRQKALLRRGKVDRGDGRLPTGARILRLEEGESLEDVLIRSGMYGDEISPAILDLVAPMVVENKDNGTITIPSPEALHRKLHPRDHRVDMLERARFIAVGPHQSWDDLANGALAGIPNDEARRGVIRALKLVNGLDDDDPPPSILVVPNWDDLAGAVTTLQQQGGSLRAASKDDLQSAMNVLFINGFRQEQAASHESCGPLPNAGCQIAFPNALRKLNEARQRVSIERSSDESYVHWLDRTGSSLSPGRQWRRKRVGERVAKDVARLQELGLVDGKGYLTFDIQDPERIEFEVGAAVDAAVRRAGVTTDSKVQEHLIAGLKNQLAGLTKGPITQVDAYRAMLIAAIGVPRDPTKPVSLIFSNTKERLLQQALLAEQFEYDPDAVTEAYNALDNPADVPIVASRIRAAVSKPDHSGLDEEYRNRLQEASMRHALAIAYLERETKDYDERIKLAAQLIEQELREGHPVGGVPNLLASLDFGS